MAVCPSCFRQQGVKKLSPRDPDPTCAHCGTPLVLEESELPRPSRVVGAVTEDLPRPKRPATPTHPNGVPIRSGSPQRSTLEVATTVPVMPDMAISGPMQAAPDPMGAPAVAPTGGIGTPGDRDTLLQHAVTEAPPAATTATDAVPVVSRRKVYKAAREIPLATPERPAPRPALNLEISAGMPAVDGQAADSPAVSAPLIVETRPAAAPHVPHSAPRTAYRREARSSRRMVVIIGSAVLAACGIAIAVLQIPRLRSDTDPAKVLEPIAQELARDLYPGYRKAADLLVSKAGDNGTRLKSAAAKLLASSVLVHGGGDTGRLDEAEKLLRSVDAGSHPPLDYDLAQGYIALARGAVAAAPKMTGPRLDLPEAQVYEGWRLLVAEGKPLQGWRSFQAALDQESKTASSGAVPSGPTVLSTVAKLGLARAREAARQTDAGARYEKVLKVSPNHLGAHIGVLRSQPLSPTELVTRINALLERHAKTAGPGEVAEAYALLGRVLRSEGRTLESDNAFSRAGTVAPTALWATLVVAEALVFDGRGQEAAARLRSLGAAGTKAFEGKLAMAGALLLSNEVSQSMSFLKSAAADQARDPRVLYWQGRHAEKAAEPEAAKEFYKQSLSMDPHFLPAALQMASLLVRQGKGQDAVALLHKAESAETPPAALQLALGQTLLATGHLAQAREAFRTALTTNADLVAARLGIASSYQQAGDLHAAHDALRTLLAEKPACPGAREKLGDVLYRLNRVDEALAIYQELLGSPTVANSVRVGAARIFLDRADPTAADPLITPVAKRDPTEPGAAICMARLLWAQGKIGPALSEFKRAMTVDTSAEAHWHYARALQASGKNDEALLQYQKAEGYPDALAERGRILLNGGQVEAALAELEKAVKLPGVTPEAWLLVGNAHEKLGQREKAAASWRTAVKLSPAMSEAFYRLGRHEMESNRAGSALDDLRQAVAGSPRNTPWLADAYFHLGYAERAKGNRAAAAKAFDRFLELAPADAPARDEVGRVSAELR